MRDNFYWELRGQLHCSGIETRDDLTLEAPNILEDVAGKDFEVPIIKEQDPGFLRKKKPHHPVSKKEA